MAIANLIDPTYRSMVLDLNPEYYALFGAASVQKIVGAGSTAYVGSPTHGIASTLYAEPANNLASRLTNAGTDANNRITTGSSFSSFATNKFVYNWAWLVRARCYAVKNTALIASSITGVQFGMYLGRNNGFVTSATKCMGYIYESGGQNRIAECTTAGAHYNGDAHCYVLFYNATEKTLYLDFDCGAQSGNATVSAGTPTGTGAFAGNFLIGAHDNGGTAQNIEAGCDVDISEVGFFTGPKVSLESMRRLVRRSILIKDRGQVRNPSAIRRFFLNSQTKRSDLIIIGDSQAASRVPPNQGAIGGFNHAAKDTVGAAGTWAGFGVHQGSATNARDGVARNGMNSNPVYASWPADLKTLVPGYQITVTDPLAAGNTIANGVAGEPLYFGSGVTIAFGTGSTNIHNYNFSDTSSEMLQFNTTGAMRLVVEVIGSTSGSGGNLPIVLKGATETLVNSRVSTTGAAPSGARTSGIYWVKEYSFEIPAGSRADAIYYLYPVDSTNTNSTGSAVGPCGILSAQLLPATPVGIATHSLLSYGGEALRWLISQMQDVGTARLASIVRSTMLGAMSAGQTPNICFLFVHALNTIDEFELSWPPDGTWTPASSRTIEGETQNIETAMRIIDDIRDELGLSDAQVSAAYWYVPTNIPGQVGWTCFGAANRVSSLREGVTGKTQLAVLNSEDITRHAEELAAGNFWSTDLAHPTWPGFLNQCGIALRQMYAAAQQGEGITGGGGLIDSGRGR